MPQSGKSKPSGWKSPYSNVAIAAIFIITFTTLVLDYYASSIGLFSQVIIAIVILVLSGTLIQRIKAFKGGYGLYMMGGKKGIETVDKISKRSPTFWKQMAIWGIVMGFGILSYPLLKGKIDKRLFAFGIISILLFLYFIIPCTALPLQFINISQLQGYASSAAAECIPSFSGLTPYGYLIYGVTSV